jgi:hypothetical protein
LITGVGLGGAADGAGVAGMAGFAVNGAAVNGGMLAGNATEAGETGTACAAGIAGLDATGAEPFCRAKLVVCESSFFSITRRGASLSPLAPNKSGTSSETWMRDWSGRRDKESGCN